MRDNLFAEMRAEFHDEMTELQSDLSSEISNISRQLVCCHILFSSVLC